jgi:hypothetical protein
MRRGVVRVELHAESLRHAEAVLLHEIERACWNARQRHCARRSKREQNTSGAGFRHAAV